MKETYENEYVKSVHQALDLFKVLGIKDVSSRTQVKNGTTVYELPIKDMNSRGDQYVIRYATYESGMVRNVSPSNSSCWQINKKYAIKRKWWNSTYKKYYTYDSYERILINNEDDRVVYLANYILKNNYRKGELYNVDTWTREKISEHCYEIDNNVLMNNKSWEKYRKLRENASIEPKTDIQVIINGHRYNLT